MLVASLLLLASTTVAAQGCSQNSTSLAFKRILLTQFKGVSNVVGNESTIASTIGPCLSADDHAEKMFNYFETFGIDLRSYRESPFRPYESDKFRIVPHVVSPATSYKVTMSSLNGYAQIVNLPIKFADWQLAAKSDLSGPGGEIPAGYQVRIGTMRWDLFLLLLSSL